MRNYFCGSSFFFYQFSFTGLFQISLTYDHSAVHIQEKIKKKIKKTKYVNMKGDEIIMEKERVPIYEKQNLTIQEAAEYSNIGINKLYELTNDPCCSFVLYVGKRRLIKRKPFEKYLEKTFEI